MHRIKCESLKKHSWIGLGKDFLYENLFSGNDVVDQCDSYWLKYGENGTKIETKKEKKMTQKNGKKVIWKKKNVRKVNLNN